jgi:hypothetical protein
VRTQRLLLIAAVALAACGNAERAGTRATEPVTPGPSIRWQIMDVSDDARTVVAFHEEPHCGSKPGSPQLTETDRSVVIRIPEVVVAQPESCTDDLRFTTSKVRLVRTLGTRRLIQHDGRAARLTRISGSKCPRILRAPAGAPLFDVPLFARERARCRRPVPRSVLALPIYQRPPTRADRLTRGERQEVAIQPFRLHSHLSRAAQVGPFKIKLVPGADQTCLFVRFTRFEGAEMACDDSRRVGRRGLFGEDVCHDRSPPRRVRALGVSPRGVAVVRMTRKGRTVASAHPDRGVYAISGEDPLRLHVGRWTARLRGATTLC